MEDNERMRWVDAKRLQAPLDGLCIVRDLAEREIVTEINGAPVP